LVSSVLTPDTHELTVYTKLEEQGFEFYRRPVRNPDGSPAWPERHPEEWIAKKERRRTSGEFQSQYLLIPARPYDVLIDPKNFPTYEGQLELDPVRLNYGNPLRGGQPVYWINGEKVRDIRAYWDTASGLKGRDNSVVAVCALTVENRIYCADLVKLPPYDFNRETRYEPQLLAVIEAMKRNFCNAIYVEASVLNNIASDLKKVAADRNIRLAVNETTRGSSTNKATFIANMIEPLYKGQNLSLASWMLDRRRCDLVKELEAFPKGAHDDHLDALAGAIHELDPRRVNFGPGAQLLNRLPLHRTKVVVVNKYQPFAGAG
jgi:phage terminase large subunit-like protein